MNIKYSIVVPVYNVEQYLPKCLDSILRQGLEAFGYEVILVNDGSTDGSVDVCEQYCQTHSNFRLIHQNNSGVSVARNRGIDEAQGEYVILVDSDDYLLDNGLKMAVEHFHDRTDVDVISYFSSYDFWEKKQITNNIMIDGTGHDFILQRGIVSFCWLFAYRKQFLDSHNIRFKPYIVGEDQLFTASVLLANPHVVGTDANIYRYVVRVCSATTKRSIEHTRRCVDDYLSSYNEICELINLYNIQTKADVYAKCIDELNFKKMFGFSRILSSSYGYKDYKRIKTRCKSVGFLPILPLSHASFKGKIQVKIMNYTLSNFITYRVAAILFNEIIVPYVLPKKRVNL